MTRTRDPIKTIHRILLSGLLTASAGCNNGVIPFGDDGSQTGDGVVVDHPRGDDAGISVGNDSCNVFATMSAPTLTYESFPQADPPSATLGLFWMPGEGIAAELPDEYFYEALQPVRGPAGVEIYTGYTSEGLAPQAEDGFVGEPMSGAYYGIILHGAPSWGGQNDELQVVLELGDRRAWTDCDHPGQDDAYEIAVTLEFDQGEHVSTSFVETVFYGDP